MLPREAMRDGSPDAAFTAGMYRHGGVVGLRASRHDLRASIQALTAYVRQCDASHVFTSVAVFFNTASPPHRDTQNENTPNLVLKLSSFSGGGLWIEDSCGSVERLVSGKPTLGKILNFQDGKLYVQAREKWHATEPWEGSRVVLVAYNLGCAAQLSADNRTDLCSLGFQPPRSVGDVASPPGDKPTILEVFSGTSRTAAAARRRGLEAHAFDHTLHPNATARPVLVDLGSETRESSPYGLPRHAAHAAEPVSSQMDPPLTGPWSTIL